MMRERTDRKIHFHFTTGEEHPMSDLYVEVASDEDDGIAMREIGVDATNRVVHRMPSEIHRFGSYGIFDNAMVRFPMQGETGDLSAAEFEALWIQPDVIPPPREYRRLESRISRISQDFRDRPAQQLLRVRARPR